MIQPALKKKAADAIGELMNMARLHRTNGDTEAADEFAGFAEAVRELAAEVKRLAIREDVLENLSDARFRINLDLETARDQLKAENEALRDDLEQIQYDANAWRNGEESVWVEVFHSDGDDPFISAITGQITIEQLALIQSEMLEYREDYFEKGSGLYVFKCTHCQAHHDNVGMTEPAHWETDFESYSPFPWEEEADAMGKGERYEPARLVVCSMALVSKLSGWAVVYGRAIPVTGMAWFFLDQGRAAYLRARLCPRVPQMKWRQESPHTILSNEGYIIARHNIDKVVRYRPSLRGSFISDPAGTAEEAKAVCERHHKEVGA